MKGTCDNCGHYSSTIEYDDAIGIWKCQKCMRATEEAVAKAVSEGRRWPDHIFFTAPKAELKVTKRQQKRLGKRWREVVEKQGKTKKK